MKTDPHEHIVAIQSWLRQIAAMQIAGAAQPTRGLSNDEKQQLQKVSRMIEQLTKLGVEVPPDLRRMKVELSARDFPPTTDPKIAAAFSELEEHILSLRELLREAREVRDRIRPAILSVGTKKHYGVKVEELIEAGLLTTEDRLELQWAKDQPCYEGRVLSDGTVNAKTKTGWKTFDSLSTAASTIGERSLNGWDHWRRVNPDGTRTLLKDIRARYLNLSNTE